MTVVNEQEFYVRPVNGSDSNAGTSFGSAWKTWQNAVDQLCFTGGSFAGNSTNAALFLVNEGTAYTGPYSTNGTNTSLEYGFTNSGGRFTIKGLSADGNAYTDTFFEFDLSGFTHNHWLYGAFSANMNYQGVLWENIIWKNADRATNSNPNWIFYTYYDTELAGFRFINCKFIDNETDRGLLGFGGYSERHTYTNCIFKGNNGYDSTRGLLNNGSQDVNNSGRGPTWSLDNCWFESNQTKSGTKFVLASSSLNGQGALTRNCVFLNNGYDSNSVIQHLHASNTTTRDEVLNNIFYNNEGTVLSLQDAYYSDATYGNTVLGRKIEGNVFVYNNKAMSFESEPSVKETSFSNNIYWNNTAEDVPAYVSGGTGFGQNRVVDPKFVSGNSGDFRAYDDSPVWVYKYDNGTPVGGAFVGKASPIMIGSTGSLSLASNQVGTVVEVSGRSFQKLSNSPIVWRRYNAAVAHDSSGNFVPTDISGLVGWWDPSDSSTVTLSGSDVTVITNKVSGGKSLVPSNASPHIASASRNGKDVLDFATNDALRTVGSLTTSSQVSIITAFDLESDSEGVMFYNGAGQWCTVYGGTSIEIDKGVGTPNYYINGNTTAFVGGSNGPNDRDDLEALISAGTGWNIMAISEFDFGSWSSDFTFMRYPTEQYSCSGLVADLIVVPSNVSTEDRQKLEGYLAHKWDLTSKLPSDHPYKIYGP